MVKVRVNWGAATEDRTVKLFEVFNTSHNRLYVLAPDRRTAMLIAHTANHVYDPSEKIALDYSRTVNEVKSACQSELLEHWKCIQKAIARRLQGTIHFDEGRLSIGDEIVR